MAEFLQLLPPEEARRLLLASLARPEPLSELVDSAAALGRVTAEAIAAPHPLPEFPRSTVDGYAVHSGDTFGATDALPAYLTMAGEIPMGQAAEMAIKQGECALIHTGGMRPDGTDATVMVEHSQIARTEGEGRAEIEVMRAVAAGENTIAVGEDVAAGSVVIPRGRRIRPAEVGGLM